MIFSTNRFASLSPVFQRDKNVSCQIKLLDIVVVSEEFERFFAEHRASQIASVLIGNVLLELFERHIGFFSGFFQILFDLFVCNGDVSRLDDLLQNESEFYVLSRAGLVGIEKVFSGLTRHLVELFGIAALIHDSVLEFLYHVFGFVVDHAFGDIYLRVFSDFLDDSLIESIARFLFLLGNESVLDALLVVVYGVELRDILYGLVVESGNVLYGRAVQNDFEFSVLTCEVFSMVIFRELDFYDFGLARLHADHLIFETGNERAAAENNRIILSGTAFELYAVKGEAPRTDEPYFGNVSGSEFSIPAIAFNRNVPGKAAAWTLLPDLGRDEGCMGIQPVTAPSAQPSEAPRLEYRVLLTDADSVSLCIGILPTQDVNPERGLRLAVSLDDEAPLTLDARQGFKDEFAEYTSANLAKSPNLKPLPRQDTSIRLTGAGQLRRNEVFDNLRWLTVKLPVRSAGLHTLKVFMTDPEVVLERIVVNPDNRHPSYFGAPSVRHNVR